MQEEEKIYKIDTGDLLRTPQKTTSDHNKFKKQSKKFSLGTWNVRGLSGQKIDFNLEFSLTQLSIFTLSETMKNEET